MGKINAFRLYLSAILTAFSFNILKSLEYLIKIEKIELQILSIIMSVFIGVILTPFVLSFATKSKTIRRIILGKDWIEGFWVNYISNMENEDSLLFKSLTEINFKSPDRGYEIVGSRLIKDKIHYSYSQYVFVIGERNFFLNYAMSNTSKPFDRFAAYGYFFKSPGSKIVDCFEGVISFPDDRDALRLKSRRINNEELKNIKNKNKEDWIFYYLKDNCSEYCHYCKSDTLANINGQITSQ